MSGIKVSLKGFDDMLDKINKANGDVNKAAEKAINDSARIAEQELKSAAISAGLKSDLVSKIKTRKTAKGNTYAAKVGWELGAYSLYKLELSFRVEHIFVLEEMSEYGPYELCILATGSSLHCLLGTTDKLCLSALKLALGNSVTLHALYLCIESLECSLILTILE